jgi:integrase
MRRWRSRTRSYSRRTGARAETARTSVNECFKPAIERANLALVKAGRAPIDGATNHSLRRTSASLQYEAGATPAYVMAQMGHADPSLALAVYTKVMERKRDTGELMGAVVRGADWAQTGTNDVSALVEAEVESIA